MVRTTVLTLSIEEMLNEDLPFHLIAPSACCHASLIRMRRTVRMPLSIEVGR
jgi:hypothetical protein